MGDARRLISEAILSDPSNYLYWHWEGRIMWDTGGFAVAVISADADAGEYKNMARQRFVKSSKLNTRFSANFTYLGHYFHEVKHSQAAAIKCYERAVELNPKDMAAGVRLSKILLENHLLYVHTRKLPL